MNMKFWALLVVWWMAKRLAPSGMSTVTCSHEPLFAVCVLPIFTKSLISVLPVEYSTSNVSAKLSFSEVRLLTQNVTICFLPLRLGLMSQLSASQRLPVVGLPL